MAGTDGPDVVVELRGHGPFGADTLVPKATARFTLRAAKGYSPVVELSGTRGRRGMIMVRSSLDAVFEDIHFVVNGYAQRTLCPTSRQFLADWGGGLSKHRFMKLAWPKSGRAASAKPVWNVAQLRAVYRTLPRQVGSAWGADLNRLPKPPPRAKTRRPAAAQDD